MWWLRASILSLKKTIYRKKLSLCYWQFAYALKIFMSSWTFWRKYCIIFVLSNCRWCIYNILWSNLWCAVLPISLSSDLRISFHFVNQRSSNFGPSNVPFMSTTFSWPPVSEQYLGLSNFTCHTNEEWIKGHKLLHYRKSYHFHVYTSWTESGVRLLDCWPVYFPWKKGLRFDT